MNDPLRNLEDVLRRTHAGRDVPEPPAAWTADVLRSIRSGPAADGGRIWLWGAALATGAATAVILLALTGDFWDLGLGSEWFRDPAGLAALWLLDV